MTQVISKKNSIKPKEKCCLPFNGITYMLKQTSYRRCFMIMNMAILCAVVWWGTDNNRLDKPI